MEKEFDLQVSNHDFNAAKEQLKKFAEQDVEELKFDKVRTHEDIFGLDLYEAGFGPQIEAAVKALFAGKGSIRTTLHHYVMAR